MSTRTQENDMNETTPEAPKLKVGSEELTFRVSSGESGGGLAVFEVSMPPGGGPPLMHRHDPTEVYVVAEGELAIYLLQDDGRMDRKVTGPGEYAYIESGRPHTIRNEGDVHARAFGIFIPGESMERFMRTAAGLPEGTPPDDLMALAEEHGIEFTGNPSEPGS